jgi:uncharacterized coiled-coil DUF342 family protein
MSEMDSKEAKNALSAEFNIRGRDSVPVDPEKAFFDETIKNYSLAAVGGTDVDVGFHLSGAGEAGKVKAHSVEHHKKRDKSRQFEQFLQDMREQLRHIRERIAQLYEELEQLYERQKELAAKRLELVADQQNIQDIIDDYVENDALDQDKAKTLLRKYGVDVPEEASEDVIFALLLGVQNQMGDYIYDIDQEMGDVNAQIEQKKAEIDKKNNELENNSIKYRQDNNLYEMIKENKRYQDRIQQVINQYGEGNQIDIFEAEHILSKYDIDASSGDVFALLVALQADISQRIEAIDQGISNYSKKVVKMHKRADDNVKKTVQPDTQDDAITSKSSSVLFQENAELTRTNNENAVIEQNSDLDIKITLT